MGLNLVFNGDKTFQRHSPFQYAAISSYLFSVLFDFPIFTPPNLNIFSTSVFSEIYYAFCFENF